MKNLEEIHDNIFLIQDLIRTKAPKIWEEVFELTSEIGWTLKEHQIHQPAGSIAEVPASASYSKQGGQEEDEQTTIC